MRRLEATAANEATATSAGTLKAAEVDSSSTTIHKEEDLLQLKWEATMGSKFTIVVIKTYNYINTISNIIDWQKKIVKPLCKFWNFSSPFF